MSANEPLDQPDDIGNLQHSFTKQQKKISALKELVRKMEVAHGKSTSSAQEKVKNIAQRMTQLKFKARSRNNLDSPTSPPLQENTLEVQQNEDVPRSMSAAVEEAAKSGSEKFQLLRQQMEENKLRMAQRASSKQHLEQLVTQLKEKFDSTQQYLDDTTELGKSMSDLSAYMQTPVGPRERFKSATDLSMQTFSLEKERIKFLENRCRLLEKQLEKEKEKQAQQSAEDNSTAVQLLEAKVKELELALQAAEQSQSLGLPSTQLVNASEEEMLSERLQQELAVKSKRIAELEEVNDVVETARFDLQSKLNESDVRMQELQEQLMLANEKLRETEQKCVELQESQPVRVTAILSSEEQEEKSATDEQVKAEMAKQIQELQDKLRSLETENVQLTDSLNESTKLEVSDENIAEKIAALEATIESQREELTERRELIGRQEEALMEKSIELNVLNANFRVLEEKLEASNKNKQLFPQAPNEENNPALVVEVQQLKQKLDENNKAMIKLKLKCKQSEKQVEKLKKSSDLHGEVVALQKLNEQLHHKITELEDEKGQWQLAQVDDTTTSVTKQLETIRLLEQEKFEHMQEIEKLQQQLENHTQTDRVKSEMSEIKWEEQLAEQKQSIEQLQTTSEALKSELETLQEENKQLLMDKENLEKKVEHYVAENMELLNKVEKLSKSSSSAESIEIVERLTQQERAELAEYDKRMKPGQHETTENVPSPTVHELTQTEMTPDLSESLVQLREESSELMNKIELFTNERREVLDRMEVLSTDNQELLQKIEELNEQRELAETNALLAENAKSRLEEQLQQIQQEKHALEAQVIESTKLGSNMSQELTSLQKTSEVVAALDNREGPTLFDKCEKSLNKLNSELEAYRKATDKGAKFNASKKLAKEAKNAYTQLSELLLKVKEASSAVETVTVVETVVAVTAPNGKALAEYEQLTAQNRDLKKRVNELEQELEELQDAQNMASSEVPAIGLEVASEALKLKDYEKQCDDLRVHVDSLRQQLHEERLALQDKTREVNDLKDELNEMQRISADFDRLLNEKENDMASELEKMARLRNELEGKCETYAGEMEILQTLVREQKEQLIEAYKENEQEVNVKLKELQDRDEEMDKMRQELQELRERNESVAKESAAELAKECERLAEALRINKVLVREQIEELSNKQETIDTLNAQISELYKTMEDNVQSVIEKEDKIAEMDELFEYNNRKMEALVKDNNEQKAVVDKLLNELHALGNDLPRLGADVARLEKINKELEQQKQDQLEKLKKYAVTLKKRTAQCQEFERKIKELEKGALEELQSKEHVEDLELLQRLEEKTQAMQEIQTALQGKTVEVLEAEEQVSHLEEQLSDMHLKLKESNQKIVQLQNALAAEQITDNQIQTELAERNLLIEQQQQEIKQLQEQLVEVRLAAEEKAQQLAEELKAKSLKFDKSKAVIKERNNQLQRLQAEVQQLQQQLSQQTKGKVEEVTNVDTAAYEALQQEHVALQAHFSAEKSNFKETIERLETLHAGIQAKLQEDMLYIETLEQDNARYKEKICKLEDAVAAFEERRASMERHASLLDAQMQTRADEYERSEDELVYRLNMLSEHDDIIAQRLLKTDEEKEALQEQLQQLQQEFGALTKQHSQLHHEFSSYKATAEMNMEAEHSSLKEQLAASNEELQRVRKECEKKVRELEDLDTDMSEHMSVLQDERSKLTQSLERAQDEVNEHKDVIMRLQATINELEQSKAEWERESTWLRMQHENAQQDQYEVQELRMQSMQDKTELENMRHQIEGLLSNHEIELQALRSQIFELDTLRMQVGQNQTDDQVFIESENKRLTELLTEKQALIETYQRQQTVQASSQHDLNNVQSEMRSLRDANAELQRQLLDKTNELEELRRRRSNANGDIIPAPAMFFATEQAITSPFDEIVQSRAVAPLEAQQAQPQPPIPTIEDLQRNVSDLEKHAQDLEQKLAARNQRDADNERQRQQLLAQITGLEQQMMAQIRAAEQQLQERNQEIESLQRELQDVQIAKTLESQILPSETKLESVVPTLDMFFGHTAGMEFEQLVAAPKTNLDHDSAAQEPQPVVEELIVPKKAYICEPHGEPASVESAGQLSGIEWGDDGWAGSEDVAAAVEHFDKTTTRQTSLLSHEKQLELQLQETQERVQELQLALEHSESQKQELQLKSSRMMKKLKEYKVKLDTQKPMVHSRNSMESNSGLFLDDLDAAIQDELKAQVQKLETRVAEQQKLLESQTAEKEKLLQRIDVVEAGNERMADLKERQDMEVQMYQTRIRELQEKLQGMRDWDGDAAVAEQTIKPSGQETDTPTVQQLQELTAELQDVIGDRQELQALLDEERANVASYESSLRELQQQLKDMKESSSAEQGNLKAEHNELKLQHQDVQQKCHELNDKQLKLQTELQKAKAQVEQSEELVQELQSELMDLRTKNAELLQANEELAAEVTKQRAAKLETLPAPETTSDEIMMQLAEKDSEISHLKQQVEDLMREDQTEKLVLEILSKNQEIHMLKMKLKDLEDDKRDLEHNLSMQLTQEMQANKEDTLKLERERIEKLEEQVKSLELEKQSMEEELQVLNNHVMQSLEQDEKMKAIHLELDVKNIEIMELRKTLQTSGMEDRIAELNAQWEVILEQRCSDIAQMWRTHLDEREHEFKATELQLQRQIEQLHKTNSGSGQQQQDTQKPRGPTRGISTETNTGTSTAASETSSPPVSETSSAAASKDNSPLHRHVLRAGGGSGDDDENLDNIVEKMQAALESQEMEIVTLKEQLAIRSAEYARLAAQYDPFNSSNTPTDTRRQVASAGNSNDANSSVPKSELDLALYMLHQRDMRCEEMTLELVQLLEERDTLQLKLSNTLRQVEAMKSTTQNNQTIEESFGSEMSGEENISSQSTASTADPAHELSQKLSQLHSVSHSKDMVIVEEREQRVRQIENMQQDVAKMPSAAISELIGSDLSQSNESPSTLLLNWLWGNNKTSPSSPPAGNTPPNS